MSMSPGGGMLERSENTLNPEDDLIVTALKNLMIKQDISLEEAARICREDMVTASGPEAKNHLIALEEAVRFIKWQRENSKK